MKRNGTAQIAFKRAAQSAHTTAANDGAFTARSPTTAAARPRSDATLTSTYGPRTFAAGRRIFVRDAEALATS